MIDTFRKIRDLLDARERRNAVLLFGMMLVMGLLETIGVASIMPFFAVVSNSEMVHTNAYLAAVYEGLGFTSTDGFLLFLGAAVFALVLGSLAFKALTHWAVARYTHMLDYSLSSRLLRGYLGRPYSWFLNRHSADLGKSVLSEVEKVIGSALIPGMHMIANTIVAALLIALVVMVEPVVALVAVVLLGGAYALIYQVLRRYLSRIGADRVRANQERFQIVQEALGGIKDVKVLGLENGYIRSFRQPASRFARCQASNQIIGELPQYALQALVFGGMLGLLLTLMATREGDLGAVLPLMALYAFAGYRLLPALQRVYKALTQLRYGKPALDILHKDLVETGMAGLPPDKMPKPPEPEPIRLRKRLELHNVHYTYPQAERPALNSLSLTIQAKTTVALVGTTGAGKTTAVDLILGLLTPQQGEVQVDGISITEGNVRAWQCNIGYVSQHIFLTDDTVAGNIAFGVPENEVDLQAVERAARNAALHDFVTQELPKGYDTMVGERGVRLSGGQRQRIGIARALYHDPDVLILDEATSSLDNLTERSVMDAVHDLGHRKTIILIAHRLSTVQECDTIFLLEQGRLVDSGTYKELERSCTGFRTMAAGVQ